MPTTLVVAVVLALMLGLWAEYALLSPGKVALEKQTKTWWVKKVDKKKEIVKILKEKGYNNKAIAAIIGNIDVETGGTFNYQQKQKGGAGYGLFQFDFMKSYYEDYLKKYKKEDSIKSQIDFMDDVIRNKENILGAVNAKKLLNSLSGDNSVDQMTLDFQNIFEQPGKPHTERRKKSANNFFKESMSQIKAQPFTNEETQEQFLDIVANNSIVDNDHFFKQLDTEIGLEKLGGPWRRLSGSISADTKLGTFTAGAEQVFSEEGDTMPEAFSLEYKNGGFSASMYKQDEYEKIKLNFRKKF